MAVITQITASLPDVVLLDVHLPSGGGQAVVSSVKAAHPEVRFLALSASDAPEDVIAVIRAVTGASGKAPCFSWGMNRRHWFTGLPGML